MQTCLLVGFGQSIWGLMTVCVPKSEVKISKSTLILLVVLDLFY